MSSDDIIACQDLGKSFRIYRRPEDRLKELLFRRRYHQDFWALRGVDLTIGRGETVGVIGRNGSGKSTLLQLICGTLQPSAGEVRVRGRIAALLELGAGFNPEFTGRENVWVSASVLGLPDDEIAARFAAIEAFAEIGDAIDQPMRHYSSGMYARLAFAVCAHVDADVLMIDEVLGIGDAAFQQKCMRHLHEFRRHGTLVFVSHDAAAVARLCDRVVWLERGAVRAVGSAKEMNRRYLAALSAESVDEPANFRSVNALPPERTGAEDPAADTAALFDVDPDAPWLGRGGAVIERAGLHTPGNGPLRVALGGEEVELRIDCRAERALARPIIGFVVRDRLGQVLFGDDTFLTSHETPSPIAAGQAFAATFRFQLPYFVSGHYALEAMLFDGPPDDPVPLARIENASFLTVQSRHVSNGLMNIAMRSINLAVGQTAATRPWLSLMRDPAAIGPDDIRAPVIWLEVEDFLAHFDWRPKPSGIQRVQMEIFAEIDASGRARRDVRFCRLNRSTRQFEPVDFALIAATFHDPPVSRSALPPPATERPASRWFADTRRKLHNALGRWRHPPHQSSLPPMDPKRWPFHRGDTLVCLGASWADERYGDFVKQAVRGVGMRFAILIYDLIPVTDPQWMEAIVVQQYRRWITEMIETADLVLTISKHTRMMLLAFAAAQGLTAPATNVLPLGTGFRLLPPAATRDGVIAQLPKRYVLLVSTIEIRKNHRLLVQVWRRLIAKHGADRVPHLVFIGGAGWLVDDLLAEIAASRHLDGKILIFSDLGDAEVKEFYRRCLFTVYPSLGEGWGLPVAESLEEGKLCVASNRTSIPEVGGDLVDYIDPADEGGSLAAIERAIFDDAYRRGRAARIVAEYRPRPWGDCVASLLDELDRLGAADEAHAPLDRQRRSTVPSPSSP